MEKHRISSAMRFFFAVSGTIIWLGIWLTGLDKVHWLLYIPAFFFCFAAAIGLCTGLIISRMLFPEKQNGKP